MSKKVFELLKSEGPELSAAFSKASISGRRTPQEVADRREAALRAFIGRYFPFPYRVTKGNLIDSFGGESDSIDCVLLHPSHPHTIDEGNHFSVIMADGVQAAIELKSDIQSAGELRRGLEQAASVKKLRRFRSSLVPLIGKEHKAFIVEESKRIPVFIFSESCKSNPIDTAREMIAYYRDAAVPLHDQADFLIINNLGIISNYKHDELCLANTGPGVYWEDWGDLTLAAFLYDLNNVLPPETHMRGPMLNVYLRSLSPRSVVKVSV